MPLVSRLVPTLALLLTALAAAAADDNPLAPFRAPDDDEARFVVRLPPQPDETALQVELLVGQVMRVDCNRHSFGGKLSRKTILRRGLSYHSIGSIGPPMATRMACPDSSLHDEFVTLGSEPYMVPYSSNAPIVIYVPRGFEVRWRVWRADETLTPAALQ